MSTTNHPILGRLLKVLLITLGSLTTLLILIFLLYVYLYYPRTAEPFEIVKEGATRHFLIATQESEFKSVLVQVLCDSLSKDTISINGIDVGDLDKVDPNEYENILIINSFIISLNSDVDQFLQKHDVEDKTLLMITSGGADWQPEASLKVDAITSASRTEYAPDLVSLIMHSIRSEEEHEWLANDYVLALKYFPRTPVNVACDSIRLAAEQFKSRYADLRRELNGIGYMFLRLDRVEDALAVLGLNIELYPESWNVYDSYAEALLQDGNTKAAIRNYEIALKLNPKATSAISALERLQN